MALLLVVVDDDRLIVEELRDELVKCSAIPAADQILLGGPPYARLDPRRSIAHYGLPAVSPMLIVCGDTLHVDPSIHIVY